MRKYEIMLIINPTVDERQVTPNLEKHLQAFTEAGGVVDNFDLQGKRKMAYEIQKHAEGIYVVLNLSATPQAVNELNRKFTIDETIMRTKVMRTDAH